MARYPKWRFYLADSLGMARYGILDVTNRNLNITHNASGTAGFQMHMDNTYAKHVWPYTAGVIAQRFSPKTNLWTDKWSGYCSDIEEDYDAETMTVSVVGWLQWLEERILRIDKDYTSPNPDTGQDWKDWEIIRDIVVYANRDSIPVPNQAAYTVPTLFWEPGVPATKYPLPLQWGGAIGDFSTHVRKGWPAERGTQLLEIVKRLCDLENGCDIRVDPTTRKLWVYDKKMSLRPGAQFGYRAGSRNISSFKRRIDTSTSKNYFEAIGPTNLASQYADTKSFPDPVNPRDTGMPGLGENSMKYYGLMEESQNITDAKTSDVLATYAAGEVFLGSSPRLLYDLTPEPYYLPDTANDGSQTPEPFEDYDVGDQIYVSAKRAPRINVSNQGMRTFNMNVSIDNESDSEIIGTLQVSAS